MTPSAPLPQPKRIAQRHGLQPAGLWIALAALLALNVALALTVNWVSDDAFISYRFARHLAEGHGLVWNLGETPPVEGYSNFLYVLILGLGSRLGLPLITASIWLNLLCSCLTLALAWRLTFVLAPRIRFLSLAPPLLLALNANFRYWAVGGLETHLYALLLLAVVLVMVKGWPGLSPRRLAAVSLLLALAALTRPEGLGIFAGIAAGLSIYIFRLRRQSGYKTAHHALLSLWLPFLLLIGLHFLWRLSYYDAPLPNTYYAKTGGGWWQWRRGLGYFWHYFLDYDTLLMPVLMASAAPFWRTRTWLLAGVAALQAAAVVYVGGDGLIHYRFVVPLLPLAYVLLAVSLHDWLVWLHGRWPDRGGGARQLPRIALALVVALLAVLLVRRDAADTWQRLREYPSWIRQGDHVAFGGRDIDPIADGARHLGRHLPVGTVVAANLIGRFGFYTELTLLDRLGLCDRHIARVKVPDMGHHLAGHEKRDPAYIFARRPEVILVGSRMVLDHPCPEGRPGSFVADWDAIDLMAGDKELIALPGFWEVYTPEIVPAGEGLYLHLLRRRDFVLPGAMTSRLGRP